MILVAECLGVGEWFLAVRRVQSNDGDLNACLVVDFCCVVIKVISFGGVEDSGVIIDVGFERFIRMDWGDECQSEKQQGDMERPPCWFICHALASPFA